MVWAMHPKSMQSIHAVMKRVITTGQMSRQDHSQLATVILSDHPITDEERQQINRIFDYIQTGRLRLVD